MPAGFFSPKVRPVYCGLFFIFCSIWTRSPLDLVGYGLRLATIWKPNVTRWNSMRTGGPADGALVQRTHLASEDRNRDWLAVSYFEFWAPRLVFQSWRVVETAKDSETWGCPDWLFNWHFPQHRSTIHLHRKHPWKFAIVRNRANPMNVLCRWAAR